MIEKMRKYSFVLYHLDYESFLTDLQNLGLVHIIRNVNTKTDFQLQSLEIIKEYNECSKYLTKLSSEAKKQTTPLPTKALLNKINRARDEKEEFVRRSESVKKLIHDLEPWGHFDYELLKKLRANGISLDFHSCQKSHFKQEWAEKYPLQVIGERSGILYFVVLTNSGSPALEADSFSFHHHTMQEFENELAAVKEKIADIEEYLKDIAPTAIEMFTAEIKQLSQACDYEDATHQGISEVEDHLRILSGWIPVSLEKALIAYLDQQNVIHFSEVGKIEDNPPIKLHNNWFARLFEPISKMYMLPNYNEFDLTPFFAPFFMFFFGFCNSDMVYGVLIILLAMFLRYKAKNAAMKSLMTLVMLFGVGSIIMGWIMGSALGYDLKAVAGIGDKIIIRNNEQIFNFALLLGVIQILFGIGITIVKQMRQSGFKHGIASVGTFLLIAGLSVLGASQLGADITSVQPYLKYPMYIGLALILLFNSPGRNPIFNILNGLWLLYGIVTGFFGDILSYIRLFALGVSSAILGFVVNSIGAQMSHTPVIGPIVFVIFMLFGHGLNLALGGLSGFVHPLRLTFVEFYKNATFTGPGTEYNPFSNKE
ncbi:MAG: V-type ATPase 116kDa subunit family protein [Candidatus Cloacimonas sp.]|jgi:V/A-type H+-transporting ATPase subunit I|nr:V-type ATPase 116kDa subunit family protein [Candidatus Cloacimonas sp.]